MPRPSVSSRLKKATRPRVALLRETHSSSLQAMASTQDARPSLLRRPDGAFSLALAMDPTDNAQYLHTIIQWLLAGHARFDDGRRIRDALERLHRGKHQLPRKQRDIGHYRTLHALEDVVAPLTSSIVTQLPDDIAADSPLVASGDGWGLFRVETTRAATFWADGTRWCTRHPTTSSQYLHKAPLYVLAAGRHRLQMHVPSQQLMDRDDHQIRSLPPDLMVPAFEAMLAQVPAHGTDEFLHPLRFRMHMESLLDAVDGGDRLGAYHPAIRKAVLQGNAKVSANGRVAVYTHYGEDASRHDDSKNAYPTLILTIDEHGVARVDEFSSGTIFDESVHARIPVAAIVAQCFAGIPREVDAVQFRTRTADLLASTLAHQKHCAVVLDGDAFLVHFDEQPFDDGDPCPYAINVLDPSAPLGSRVHRLSRPSDLLAVPSRISRMLSFLQQDGSTLLPFEILGPNVIEDTTRWRTSHLKTTALTAVLKSFERDGQPVQYARNPRTNGKVASTCWRPRIEDLIGTVFADSDHDSINRLLRPILGGRHVSLHRERFVILHAKDGGGAGMGEALLSIKDVPGAGLLLAAIPDSECTEDLIESLLDAGRWEAMQVAPPRFLTRERGKRAIGAELPFAFQPFFAARSVSLGLQRYLDEARNNDPLEDLLIEMISGKSQTWMQDFQRIRSVDTGELLEGDYLAKAIRRRFAGIPPVGLPWGLAMESLRRSLDGLEDFMIDFLDDRWALHKPDTDDKVTELLSIPGVSEAILRMRTELVGALLPRIVADQKVADP